jgi:hypothetical protein
MKDVHIRASQRNDFLALSKGLKAYGTVAALCQGLFGYQLLFGQVNLLTFPAAEEVNDGDYEDERNQSYEDDD